MDDDEVPPVMVCVSVTGQMVVDTAMVTTVVVMEWAGQLVTVAAQLVMVDVMVVKTVDVLRKLVVMTDVALADDVVKTGVVELVETALLEDDRLGGRRGAGRGRGRSRGSRSGRHGRRGGGSVLSSRRRRVARERHGGDADAAGRLGLLRLRRVDDADVLGAAALGVLDDGAAGGAGRPVLALGPIGHAVVELEVAVELDAEVDLADGELVDGRAALAAERRRAGLVGAARGADDLATGAAAVAIALAEARLAAEAAPAEVVVAGEEAQVEIAKVEAGRLLVGAVVVGVAGAGEGVGIQEALQAS